MATYQIRKQQYNAVQWTGDNKEEIEAFINNRRDYKVCASGDLLIREIYGRIICHKGAYLLECYDGNIITLSAFEFDKQYELVPHDKNQNYKSREWVSIINDVQQIN